MLTNLSIKDFAIIESIDIDFQQGFTVLTGETGAGKSILIGAISFLLGGQSGADDIRYGCTTAQVTGTFDITGMAEAAKWLTDHDIDYEDDTVIVRRYIKKTGSSVKSSAKICSTPVTRSDCEEFASFLVDMHTQNAQQSLLKTSEHQKALDARAGITAEVADFAKLYASLVEKQNILDDISKNIAQRERDKDMYNFAINEIESAKLQQNEDADLETEESRLSSFEKLYAAVQEARNSFDGDGGVVAQLRIALKNITQAATMDKALDDLSQRLDGSFADISDISQELASYGDNLVFDPARLEEVQNRLSLIDNLKKKYATASSPLSAVFDYLAKSKTSLDNILNSSSNQEELQAEISRLQKTVLEKARAISQKRHAAADVLSKEIENILQDLGMKGAKFCVSVTTKAGDTLSQRCSAVGIDNIEFLIATNAGTPLSPLTKIASGGELSRVMLSLNTVLSQSSQAGETNLFDSQPSPKTIVFDEIDAGIGGAVAVSVGKHIAQLAKHKQIFCITHQASIACMANHHARIDKSTENNSTRSTVNYIDGDDRVQEIARMLSGDTTSEESLSHARGMLSGAD